MPFDQRTGSRRITSRPVATGFAAEYTDFSLWSEACDECALAKAAMEAREGSASGELFVLGSELSGRRGAVGLRANFPLLFSLGEAIR